MSVTVEKCTPTDTDYITAAEQKYIECAWSESNVRDALSSDGYTFFKAVESGESLGYGGIQWCAPEGNICNIAVESAARRRGIGTLILRAIEDEAKIRAVTDLYLEVNEHNGGAIALYEKNGFSVVGKRPRYYGSDAAVLMKKEI